MLIAAGADLDMERTVPSAVRGTTALFVACEHGRTMCVERLLAAGADVDKPMKLHSTTPLYVASQNGHVAIVAKLLKYGADKSIRGWQNETALERATAGGRSGHPAIAILLGPAPHCSGCCTYRRKKWHKGMLDCNCSDDTCQCALMRLAQGIGMVVVWVFTINVLALLYVWATL